MLADVHARNVCMYVRQLWLVVLYAIRDGGAWCAWVSLWWGGVRCPALAGSSVCGGVTPRYSCVGAPPRAARVQDEGRGAMSCI